MTVLDLIEELQKLVRDGHGDRIVRMGDPRTDDYAEVTGIWIPRDDDVVDLESVEWGPPLQSSAT